MTFPWGEGVSWHCHLAGASGTNALWGGKGTVMNVLHTRWRALVLALLLAVSLAVPAAAAETETAAEDLQTLAMDVCDMADALIAELDRRRQAEEAQA